MHLIGNVHIVQGGESELQMIMEALEASGIDTAANPDIDVRTYAQFRVEDARSLVDRAQTKAITASRRVFITISPNLLYEAQNTLLKTLEEPVGDALFFFVVPAPDALLPTVRSRAQIHASSGDHASGALDAREFLSSSPQKRLDMLKVVLAKDEDDPEADASRRNGAGVRDISGALTLLSSLEHILAKSPRENRAGIEAVYRARKYIGDKGSLIKALLEQVALLTPMV